MRNILLFLSLLCGLTATRGQSLDECRRLARENFPLVRRYDLLRQSEALTLDNIKKDWLPRIGASAQATWQSDVVKLPEALQSLMQQMNTGMEGLRRNQYRLAIDVRQTVYDGGEIRARRQVAQARTAVDESRNEVDLYALRERVDELYFSLLLIDERLALNRQKQDLLQANEDKLSAMLRGGVAMESDRDAVRAERLTALQAEAQLESSREAVRQVLSLFCGREIGEVERPPLPSAALLSDTVSLRPELTLFERQLSLTRERENALRARWMPRLSVFAQGYYGYPGYNMYEDMLRHRWTLNAMVGTRLSWNISGLYTRRNDRAQLANERAQIENSREVFLFNTRMEGRQEQTLAEGYRRIMAQDEEIVRLRTDVRRAAEAKLEHGIVDVTALVQEISRENEALINASTHAIEQLQHLYRLQFIHNR